MIDIKKMLRVMVIVGVIASLILGYNRMVIDAKNNVVELALDFRDLTELSRLSGRSIPNLLDEAKKAKITDIAIYEDTIMDLTIKGKAAYLCGAEIRSLYATSAPLGQKGFSLSRIRPGYQYILFTDLSACRRAFSNLSSRYGQEVAKMVGDRLIEIATVDQEIEMLSMGYDPEMVAMIHERGLKTVAVLRNDGRIKKEGIQTIVNNIHLIGADIAISLGKEVAAYAPPGANQEVSIADLTEALKREGVGLGFLEMVAIEGKGSLVESAGQEGVKIHEVAEWRTEKSTPAEVVATIRAAVRDRSIRLVYLRFFLKGATGPSLAERNIAYLQNVRESLVSAGYRLGDFSVPKVEESPFTTLLTALISLAVLAGFALLLLHHLKVSRLAILALFSAIVAVAFLATGREVMLFKGLALLAACLFPALSLVSMEKEIIKEKSSPLRYLSSAILLIKVSLITLTGGLIVSSLLLRESFLLGVDTFTGVKIAYLAPILAVIHILSQRWQPIKGGLKEFFNEPILVKYVILGGFMTAAAAFYLIRSGNASAEFVPASELLLRKLLDSILLVRPRFKEFLIGHPALILAASGLFDRKTTWALAILATIGQISLANTFCHTYSPLWVSLFRSFNGLVLGLLIGLVAAFIYEATAKFIKNAS
ncbi:MAG: DUF5693 family protein [Actinomycetota bacterium]|nr:DUF5693 family protein [Actinomycetota bacterium]